MNSRVNESGGRNAEELIRATAQDLGELAALATHQIEAGLQCGKETLSDMRASIRDCTRDCLETTGEFVERDPWKAVFWAAGIGLVMGMLMRR